MFHAMQCYTEGYRTYQSAVRQRGFPTLEQAKTHAIKKAKGVPFVSQGVEVVWTQLMDKLKGRDENTHKV